jgi:hypothetical protein
MHYLWSHRDVITFIYLGKDNINTKFKILSIIVKEVGNWIGEQHRNKSVLIVPLIIHYCTILFMMFLNLY